MSKSITTGSTPAADGSFLLDYVPREHYDSYEDFAANCHITVPESFNFAYDIVDRMAARWPEKTALVWCDEAGNEATFIFADVKRESDRVARFLQDLGIRKGDRVMLILKRRYEFWFCILALHKLGAIAIPATHLLTVKDLYYRNNAAGVRAIIAVGDARVLDAVDAAHPESPTLEFRITLTGSREGWINFAEAMANTPADFPRPTGEAAVCNTDLMLLYFTSGTTGMPKMVTHNFTYPLGHIYTSKFWHNVNPNSLHLTVSDTGWAKSVWGKIYGEWIAGSAIFVYDYERFEPRTLLSILAKYHVTSFCAPPTIFRFLIREDLTQYDLSALQYVTTAGEPLNPEVYNRFLEHTGLRLMEGYGQTESVVMIATYPWVEPRPGSMGKPTPGYRIDIVRDDATSCAVHEEGQIVIRIPDGLPIGLFCGYYLDPALTKASLHDGLYYTGDMAWRDDDGYYWFVGRADDLMKTSGYRVGPFEVESALLEHPAVVECAVTGVPDHIRGQVIKASIILAPGYSGSEHLVLELQEHVRKVTAPFKYPRIIEFVTELPKTISGKIRRVEIREGDAHEA